MENNEVVKPGGHALEQADRWNELTEIEQMQKKPYLSKIVNMTWLLGHQRGPCFNYFCKEFR
jgi:hypothetical protein